jgi:hypothetical protein
MTFLEAMDLYFGAEKRLAWLLAAAGLVVIAVGLWLWRGYGGGLGAAMGITLLVVGLAASAGGVGLARTVSRRGDALAREDKTDRPGAVARELARMEKVNAAWPWLERAWAVLMLAAVAGFTFVKRDWVTGLCLALILLSALLFVIDTFAERRALLYTERIAAAEPRAQGPASGPKPHAGAQRRSLVLTSRKPEHCSLSSVHM